MKNHDRFKVKSDLLAPWDPESVEMVWTTGNVQVAYLIEPLHALQLGIELITAAQCSIAAAKMKEASKNSLPSADGAKRDSEL